MSIQAERGADKAAFDSWWKKICSSHWLVKLLDKLLRRFAEDIWQEAYKNGYLRKEDELAIMLFERNGYGTLQLSKLGHVPRIKFTTPDKTRQVNTVELSNGEVINRHKSYQAPKILNVDEILTPQ